MTIPEAVSLVLQAGGAGSGGQLYVLDMGEPINIRDLAEQMIRFYGYEPGRDIPITEIGMRTGEKLHETLLDIDEEPGEPVADRIFQVQSLNGQEEMLNDIDSIVETLRPVCFFDESRPAEYRNRWKLREILHGLFPDLQEKIDEPEY
jgi:FlaA1/EpsC-like NDP-sugar epimerase